MHINVDKPNIKMAPHTLNHTRVVKEWVETVVKVHESVGLMAGGTSLVINPSEWPKPLNGVSQVAPTPLFATKSRRERRKKRLDLFTIWLHRERVGSQSSLKEPLGMSLAFGRVG